MHVHESNFDVLNIGHSFKKIRRRKKLLDTKVSELFKNVINDYIYRLMD